MVPGVPRLVWEHYQVGWVVIMLVSVLVVNCLPWLQVPPEHRRGNCAVHVFPAFF